MKSQKPIELRIRVEKGSLIKSLKNQVTEGEKIEEELKAGDKNLTQKLSRYKSWHDFNRTLLDVSFTNKQMLMDYSNSTPSKATLLRRKPTDHDRVRWAADKLSYQIAALESVLGRIEIIPVENGFAEQLQNEVKYAVFIIHGHDSASTHEIARYVEQLDLKVIILDEQPSQGRTIIEKFEAQSDVGFTIALLTPDDVGSIKDKQEEEKYRARQNVIFELGYFMGKIGRGRVCLMQKGEIEFPSDLHGIIYIPIDESGGWKLKLLKELRAARLPVDMPNL